MSEESLRQILMDGVARMLSDPEPALRRLEEGLVRARATGDERWVSLFARNAGLISQRTGNLELALSYMLEAARNDPTNGYTQLALGESYRELGDETNARATFGVCREIATAAQDADLLQILERKA